MKVYFNSGCVDLNRCVELYGGFELVYSETSDPIKPYSLSVEFVTDSGVKNSITIARDSLKNCSSYKQDIMRKYILGENAYKLGDPCEAIRVEGIR